MASNTLNKVPDDLMAALWEDAGQERRSLPTSPVDKPVAGGSFKEFLCRGPLADIDLPRIEGHDPEIDL